MFKKSLNLTIIFCFFLTTLGPLPKAHADSVLGLPVPGTMVNLSPAYEPVIIKGLTVHKDNPFLFDFIVDVGQDKMSGEPLKKEGEKLIKYFLASLAIPDKDVWVNLSPYERNKMIPEVLGQTDMGRDLLEQDYILKQITASLIYPEKQLGKTFWDKVYSKAQEMYGTTQVPVNTFNKVWIMADRAEVFEHNQTAFVVDSHLKVMLEEDYLALQKHSVIPPLFSKEGARGSSEGIHTLSSQMVRTIILPELEKEVNTGKNFANLRQIFNSIILSSWYKKNLKEALLNQVYADKSKVNGVIASQAKQSQEQIYEQYLKAYKKGVFNYIKEDINAAGATIPRKYFSGGINKGMATEANLKITTDLAMGAKEMSQQNFNGLFDVAMLATTERRRGVDVLSDIPVPIESEAPSDFKEIVLKAGKKEEVLADLKKFGNVLLTEIPIVSDDKETHKALQRLIDLTLPKGSMLSDYKEAKVIFAVGKNLLLAQAILFTGDGYPIHFISLNGGFAFAESYLEFKSFPRGNLSSFTDLTGVILNINSKEATIQLDDVIEAKVKNPDVVMTGREELAKLSNDDISILTILTQNSFKNVIELARSANDVERIRELVSGIVLGMFKEQRLALVEALTDILRKGQTVAAAVQEAKSDEAMTGRVDVIHVMTPEEMKGNLGGMLLNGMDLVGEWGVVLEERQRGYSISVWHKEGRYASLSIKIPGKEKFAERIFDSALNEGLVGLASKSVGSTKKDEKEKIVKLIKAVATKECVKELHGFENGILKNLNNEAIVKKNLSTIIDEFISTGLIQDPLIRLAVDDSLWRIFENEEARKQAINLTSKIPEENSYAGMTLVFVLGRFIKQDKEVGRLIQDINDGVSKLPIARSSLVVQIAGSILQEIRDNNILSNPPTQSEDSELIIGSLSRRDKAALAKLPQASDAFTRGGIDLNTSNGMQWKVSKDGQGVEMNIDPAMIERIRREGIDSLSPVILRITPVTSIWPLMGLQAPAQTEHLG